MSESLREAVLGLINEMGEALADHGLIWSNALRGKFDLVSSHLSREVEQGTEATVIGSLHES